MKCIKCNETNEATKERRINNRESFREYMRNYMRNHPEVNKRTQRRWYIKNSATHYERKMTYQAADPQRPRAQHYACSKYPVRQICEIEGCFELGERHHNDYNKPYEIRWLCHKHHKALSRRY